MRYFSPCLVAPVFMMGLVLMTPRGIAQGEMGTEQPFESPSGRGIQKGRVQTEIGGWIQWATPEGEEVEDFSYSIPIGIIRYGWRDRLELRVGAQFAENLGEAESARAGLKWSIVPGPQRLQIAWISEIENRLNDVSLQTRAPTIHRMCASWTNEQRWSARGHWGLRWESDSTDMVVAGALAREVGWQGWTVYVEPIWRESTGGRIHVGGLLQIGEESQMDVGFQRDLNTGDFRFTFGYCRNLWQAETAKETSKQSQR